MGNEETLAKELLAVIDNNIPELSPKQVITALAMTCAEIAELAEIPIESLIEKLGENAKTFIIQNDCDETDGYKEQRFYQEQSNAHNIDEIRFIHKR